MYQTGNGVGTCANIKAAGVTIYTIHVNTGGDPMSTLLQNCASSTDKFWMVTSSSGLGNRVQHDRHQPDAAARRQVTPTSNDDRRA